jgi:hypothetical protein
MMKWKIKSTICRSWKSSENFSYEHPSQAKYSALVNIFKEKHDNFQKGQEEEQKKIWSTVKASLKDLKIYTPILNREPIFSNPFVRSKKNGQKQDRLPNLNLKF